MSYSYKTEMRISLSAELLFWKINIFGLELNIGVYLADFTVFYFRVES